MAAALSSLLLERIVNHRLDAVSDHRFVHRTSERVLGAYYTDSATTLVMANWALRAPTDRVLEPCFGDGSFLRAIAAVARSKRLTRVQQFGAELVGEAYASVVNNGLLCPSRTHHGDFLDLAPFEVNAVIGNPPYVRLRHLPRKQQFTALSVASKTLGQSMDPSGSVWMPFVLHATRFLAAGGRLAFVLPYEITHVRYARPLWRKLGRLFDNLRLIRVHERVFPDILQDVVLLFADGYGGSTESVKFQTFEKAADLRNFQGKRSDVVQLTHIVEGKKPFVRALLPDRTLELLEEVYSQHTQPMKRLCSFNIGYVAGDKRFFHPSSETAQSFGLPPRSLRRAVTSSRQLATCGLRTATAPCSFDSVFLPPAHRSSLTRGELRYIRFGEQQRLHERYKCQIREPWYCVPGVKTPDLLLSVFSERPVLAINDRKLVASNSLLCGYLLDTSADYLAAAWYTSLTLLQCELEIHALGGGVFVLVPSEVGNLQMPRINGTPKAHLDQIDAHLREGAVHAAYVSGDKAILQKKLRLTDADLSDIHDGLAVLRHWRTSSRGGVRDANIANDA